MRRAGGFILWESLVGLAVLLAALAFVGVCSRQILIFSRMEALQHYRALAEFEEGDAGGVQFEAGGGRRAVGMLVVDREDWPDAQLKDWQNGWQINVYRQRDATGGGGYWVGTRLERKDEEVGEAE